MFLGRLMRSQFLKNEEGSTLVPVMGLIAVSLLVLALLAASLTQSLQFTSASRAEVQSQAAAESGVLAAKNAIINRECDSANPVIEQSGPPSFRASIWRSIGATTWVAGCPIAGTTQVKILSTGNAQSTGIAGASFGDESYVEAIFSYSTGGPIASGPALLSYNGATFTNYSVTPITVFRGDIYIPKGNFSCDNNSVIDGSVIVMAGSVSVGRNCRVTGSVWARDSITLSGTSIVEGDVKSGSSTVTISSGTSVGGSVEAKLSISNSGTITDDAISGTSVTTTDASQIGRDVRSGTGTILRGTVAGKVSVNGALTLYSTSKVTGSVTVTTINTSLKYYYTSTSVVTGPTAQTRLKTDKIVLGTIGTSPVPQTPNVSLSYDGVGWIHYEYDSAVWSEAGFTEEIVWPTSDCNISPNIGAGNTEADLLWRKIESSSTPIVIDARACSSISGDVLLDIRTDVAFVGTKFNIQTLEVSSADANAHKFWIIVPDGASGSSLTGPDCGGNTEHIYISQTAIVYEPILALAYGPCTLNLPAGSQWRGQIMTGDLDRATQQHDVVYASVGLPGIDLGTGEISNQYPQSLISISQRNRSTGE